MMAVNPDRANAPKSHGRAALGTTIFLLVALGAVPLAGGCAEDQGQRQTKVVHVTTIEEDTATVTPLERGKIRRDILAVAEGGIAAWLAHDLDALPSYFTEDWVDQMRQQDEEYVAEAKTRERVHAETHMDVTELNSTATQAIVKYLFTDESYFADPSGRKLSEPTNKETEFQLTLEIKDDAWVIIRILGGKDTLQ